MSAKERFSPLFELLFLLFICVIAFLAGASIFESKAIRECNEHWIELIEVENYEMPEDMQDLFGRFNFTNNQSET